MKTEAILGNHIHLNTCFSLFSKEQKCQIGFTINGPVHPKMYFSHSHHSLTLPFFFSTEQKIRYLQECLSCSFPYNQSKWNKKWQQKHKSTINVVQTPFALYFQVFLEKQPYNREEQKNVQLFAGNSWAVTNNFRIFNSGEPLLLKKKKKKKRHETVYTEHLTSILWHFLNIQGHKVIQTWFFYPFPVLVTSTANIFFRGENGT